MHKEDLKAEPVSVDVKMVTVEMSSLPAELLLQPEVDPIILVWESVAVLVHMDQTPLIMENWQSELILFRQSLTKSI